MDRTSIEGERSAAAKAEQDWVGSRISRAFGRPHGYYSL